MASAGGKGKVSNDLVAASCAAVLAVYAAGYWRTRDEAQRLDTRAQARRAVPPETTIATVAPPRADSAAATPQPPPALPVITRPAPAPAPVVNDVPKSSAPVAAMVTPASTVVPLPAVSVSQPPAPTDAGVAVADADAVAVAIVPDTGTASAEVVPDQAYWRDGIYTGWGTSRHGDIKAQVVIRNGRIVESGIASCETRWPCDVIGDIINQPVARQSPEVDRVSRATASADAYYYGLVDALDQALAPSPQATTPR